ncbi:alpha/beta hydrolase family protein [Demequina sediminicola]|uniref:alpha/beta hydrolase family protein n=1 Tax=Demequina sediminicola TaxID=1095026 RepID=UPI0007827F41|nr:hypothetical protein [Demequina sediminicola]
MRKVAMADESRRSWIDSTQPRPVRLTVWEPDVEGPTPLTLLSHGTGGQVSDLTWLARALVAEGHTVIGVDHHGNNAQDKYLPEGFAFVWERPRDLSFALDWALKELSIDEARISAAGFSLGGYTCAALAGAKIDPEVFGNILQGDSPMPPLPEMPDLRNRLAQRYPGPALAAVFADAGADVADPRIGRIAMLAPSVGRLVTEESLSNVTVPALVLWGGADTNAAPALNAQRYEALMPHASGRSMGDDVKHYWWVQDHHEGEKLRREAWAELSGFLTGVSAT